MTVGRVQEQEPLDTQETNNALFYLLVHQKSGLRFPFDIFVRVFLFPIVFFFKWSDVQRTRDALRCADGTRTGSK